MAEQTLYSRDILRLAMELGDAGAPLEKEAQGQAELSSPICGSSAQIDVILNSAGAVDAFSIAMNACALGQASAAILRRHAAGMEAPALAELRADIAAFLAGEGAMPDIWPDLSKLAHARDYPARHGALLLPFDSLLAAMADAQKNIAA